MNRKTLSVSRGAFEVSLWMLTLLQDDVFLVTYPESGTTLLQMMLYQMTSDGTGRSLDAMPSPRIFKTHLASPSLELSSLSKGSDARSL